MFGLDDVGGLLQLQWLYDSTSGHGSAGSMVGLDFFFEFFSILNDSMNACRC